MRKSNDRFLIVGVTLMGLLVVGVVGLQMFTEHNRGAAVSKVKGTAPIERYKARLASGPKADTQAPPSTGSSAQASKAPEVSGATADSIAAYASAFAKVEAMQKQDNWKDADSRFSAKPVSEWNADDWAYAKALLEEAHELVLEIRRLAAIGGPAYALDFSKGANMELPHLARLRNFARLLREDARVQGHEGNYAEVCEDVLAEMKLANSLKEEPVLISQLVRYAVDGIALQTACDALPENGTPADIAQRLIEYAEICKRNSREFLSDTLSSDCYVGLDEFENIRSGKEAVMIAKPGNTWQEVGLWLYGSTAARPLLNMDEEVYAENMARIAEAVRLPYYEAKPILAGIDSDVRELPNVYVLSRQLLPPLTRIAISDARCESQLSMLQAGLALEQYHARTGAYPATLDSITADLGGRLPLDAFTGKPLIYRPSGDGFLLYSVSENGIDDGGRFDYKTGDIVWRSIPEKK